MTALTMLDSTTATDIPLTGADAVAGYVGGNWTTWPELVARFPNLPKLSIAVNSHEDAQCLDVEKGDATPDTVPGWLDRQKRLRPNETQIIYCPASQIPAVRAAAGSRTYLLWSAHYGKGQHRCGPGACEFELADATQWDDHGPNGEHYDRTVMLPAFLAAIQHPQPAPSKPTPAPAPVKPPASAVPVVFKKPNPVARVVAKVIQVVTRAPLAVDGVFGPATIRQWQKVMGTPEDGVISHPSALVRVVQRVLHVAVVDGDLGRQTWKAIQHHLGGLTEDGVPGPLTIKALQRRLNTRTF